MLESMSMTNKPFYDNDHPHGTPGHVLSCIPQLWHTSRGDLPARTTTAIANEMRVEIMNHEVHKELLDILKDLEANYEIVETPYGWVRMTDSVSLSMQMSQRMV